MKEGGGREGSEGRWEGGTEWERGRGEDGGRRREECGTGRGREEAGGRWEGERVGG